MAKNIGLPLEDALLAFSKIQEQYNLMIQSRNKMMELLEESDVHKDAVLSDAWTLQNLCSKLTTNRNDELILLDRALKENVNAALALAKYENRKTEDKNIALNILLNNPDELFDLICSNSHLEKDYLDKIWDLHADYWFKKQSAAPRKLEILCREFRDKVTYEHLALMVKRYVGRKMDDDARRLQRDRDLDLPQDLIDQLEGCIMMKALMKSNK